MGKDAALSKVHYAGAEEDFVVFVEEPATLSKWKDDRSIPISSFIGNFKVYVTHKQGAQGNLDAASKSTLENEFGTKNEDEAIIKILEQGTLQGADTQNSRFSDRNESQGGRQAH